MDQNKINKLQEIDYQIAPTCGTCRHFKQFDDMDFGECGEHVYTHLKHTGGKRKLSVVRYGSCDYYEQGDVEFLHGFKEFLTKDPEEG